MISYSDGSLPPSKEGWHKMLAAHHACDAAVAAFERAWSEYAALKKRHARRAGGANSAVDEDPDITGMRAALAEAHITLLPITSRGTWQAKVCVPLARQLNDMTAKGAPKQASRSEITGESTSPASAPMALYKLAALDLLRRLEDQDVCVRASVRKAVAAIKGLSPLGHPHRKELEQALNEGCSLGCRE